MMKITLRLSEPLMAFVLGCGITLFTIQVVNNQSQHNISSQTVNQKQIVNCSENEGLDYKMK